MRGKFTISSIKFHVNFFSVMLDNVVRICDKMQVVCEEMACDGAKSNVAKWNLIGGISTSLDEALKKATIITNQMSPNPG